MQNFGQIHETFKDVLANSIADDNIKHKKIFKSYLKALKENKTLRTQFNIYDILENKIVEDSESSKMLVEECISVLKSLDAKKVNELNNSLVKYLKKNGFSLTENYDNKMLHKHISNLAFSNVKPNNIISIVESKAFLNNYSATKKMVNETIVAEPYMNTFLGPAMIEKFNAKYGNLTETQKKIIKTMINGSEDDKKALYKNTILECVEIVNAKLQEECTINEKDTFLRVKDKLLRYTFNPETFINEMNDISYLRETLD